MDNLMPVDFANIDITDGFWADRQKLNREITVYSVEKRFEDTGRFRAFEFDWTEESSEIPRPHYYWDSDVAKWIESVAYIVQKQPDDELLKKAEHIIDLMEKNQSDDGYFNIYHTVVEPELKFKKRDHHELYCLGHFIEAAVAFFNATGSERLLNIVDKYIDLVIRVFTVEKSAGFVTPGHEEIELALIKLYRLKKDKKYLDLAMFFLNERGKKEENDIGWSFSNYNQGHIPVREQRVAFGHCVRAGYLYSAMADAVKETGDEELLVACKALFDDIVLKKMYITGGIGSTNIGEAFTVPYDLPNDTAYSETCASISLAMFADRMKDIDIDSKYADIVEREMYNGILSGVSLDGKAFFYENPLEINLGDRKRHTSCKGEDRLPITLRKEVFGCSCCPPNITRYIASVGNSVFSVEENSLYLHQFMTLNAFINGMDVAVETNYPNTGKVTVIVAGGKGKKLFIRIPGWCDKYTVSHEHVMHKGYACIDMNSDVFIAEIDFDMAVKFYSAHPFVRANAGKAALMRGPVVYCMESEDNGNNLFDITVDTKSVPALEFDEFFGLTTITLKGTYSDVDKFDSLYKICKTVEQKPMDVKFIPYFGFANRGESDMAVWFRYK